MSLLWGRAEVPPEITLLYREVGKTHVFVTSHEKLRGFHIGSSDLEHAFRQAEIALGEHVSRVFECQAKYTFDVTFEQFRERLAKDHDIGDILASTLVHATRAERQGVHAAV